MKYTITKYFDNDKSDFKNRIDQIFIKNLSRYVQLVKSKTKAHLQLISYP